MKKILFLLFFFIGSFTAYSQLSGGVRAGVNYTNVILGPDASYYKFKFGYQAGGYIEYDFHEKLSFQAEVMYSLKGFRMKYSNTTPTPGGGSIVVDYDVLNDLSYIDVPLMLNINFGEMGSYIGIGPQASLLIAAKKTGESSITTTYPPTNPPTPSINYSLTQDEVSKDGFTPVDFGVVLGTGAKYENGLEYCIRGGFGITSVFNSVISSYGSGSSSVSSSSDYHNLVISITLGYAFGETSGSYSKDRRYKKKGRRR